MYDDLHGISFTAYFIKAQFLMFFLIPQKILLNNLLISLNPDYTKDNWEKISAVIVALIMCDTKLEQKGSLSLN